MTADKEFNAATLIFLEIVQYGTVKFMCTCAQVVFAILLTTDRHAFARETSVKTAVIFPTQSVLV
jgi:hypothetical protein